MARSSAAVHQPPPNRLPSTPPPPPPPQYRVTAAPTAQARSFGANPLQLSFQTGGCVLVEGLQPRTEYRFTVATWTQRYGEGEAASVKATPRP